MRLKHYILLMAAALTTAGLHAQTPDTAIRANTIEITQSYQPEIKQNPKPVLHPALPPADTTHPTFNYEVPQQTLYYTFSSTPLRPLALGKDSILRKHNQYVKLGVGNLSTLLAEYGTEGIGINKLGVPAECSINFRSLSQKGSIENQKTWLLNGDIAGNVYAKKLTWNWDLGFFRNQYYNYGYDHTIYEYSAGDVSQEYTGIGLDVVAASNTVSQLQYAPSIGIHSYQGTSNGMPGKETTVNINIPVSYQLDTSWTAKAALNTTVTKYKVDPAGISTDNNVMQLLLGVDYSQGLTTGHIYIAPTIGKDANYFLPDIYAAYRVTNDISLGVGWKGDLIQNTYQQLSTENPYMFNNFDVKQTRTNELFAKVEAGIGSHLTVYGRLSSWSYDKLPMFVNNITGDMKQFDLVYDNNVNAIPILVGAKYQINNLLTVGGSIASYSFSNGDIDKVVNIPTSRIKGYLTYHPIQKLYVTAYLNTLSGITAVDNKGQYKQLDATFDLGGNVEYSFIPRLSAFVQLNNITNSKNERWLGYQSYGFNIFGGIRLKF